MLAFFIVGSRIRKMIETISKAYMLTRLSVRLRHVQVMLKLDFLIGLLVEEQRTLVEHVILLYLRLHLSFQRMLRVLVKLVHLQG